LRALKAPWLTVDEFIRRFLIHVLPKGFQPHLPNGLFASANRAKMIETAHKLLNLAQPSAEQTGETRSDAAPRAAMSLLRRPHVRHRNLRGRLLATSPANRASRRNHDRPVMIANTISRIIARFPRWYWVELPFPGSTDKCRPATRPIPDEDEAIFYIIQGLKLKDLGQAAN
jgi:hypothetical protein